MPQVLILIRGLPGSGKSTLAKQLVAASSEPMVHYEADQFFTAGGIYHFIPKLIPTAHQWCQKVTALALALGDSVIVSNTFVKLDQMKPYVTVAKMYGIPFQILECHAQFGNIHNVPQAAMESFAKKWQPLPLNFDWS